MNSIMHAPQDEMLSPIFAVAEKEHLLSSLKEQRAQAQHLKDDAAENVQKWEANILSAVQNYAEAKLMYGEACEMLEVVVQELYDPTRAHYPAKGQFSD